MQVGVDGLERCVLFYPCIPRVHFSGLHRTASSVWLVFFRRRALVMDEEGFARLS